MSSSFLSSLQEEELGWRPNEQSNSIGNQLLHLEGNIRQYIVSGIGEQKDQRQRDKEFSTQSGFNKSELLQKLKECLEESYEVLDKMTENELMDLRKVQEYELSGLSILIHVCEHFSYHTGQIAQLTKLIRNKDLGFYAGINLT